MYARKEAQTSPIIYLLYINVWYWSILIASWADLEDAVNPKTEGDVPRFSPNAFSPQSVKRFEWRGGGNLSDQFEHGYVSCISTQECFCKVQ